MTASQTTDPRPEWSAVRRLFELCLDLDPVRRREQLAAADASVRAEVEALLGECKSRPGVLDPDTAHREVLASTVALATPGTRIGGYRLVELLGRGGMGTVFLAEQEAPRRQVALKLFAAAVLGDEAERRFRAEAELLGRLQHRGIAQIHEAAVHEQRSELGTLRWPYFAMEFVAGARTLADWAAAAPRGERAILDVVLQVCDAVQHAHERGVVHRDLKPQNVLLDGADQVKVIDFGIARSLGHDGDALHAMTRTGELVGTLRYMSPEQVRGQRGLVDTRTDVHALGVVAYELLAGRLPFDVRDKNLPEVARILGEVEATPLRRVRPDADPDLERILATALAKDPQRRYATAGALADDLRRYVRREPIAARPPTFAYQLRMLWKRRRGSVAAVLALVAVGAIGGVTSLVYAVRAHLAEQRAIAEGQQKASAMRRVFDLAMQNVLDVPRRLAGTPEATALRSRLIGHAVQQLQFFEQNAPLDDASRLSLANAYLELGNVQGGGFSGHVGERQEALQSYATARTHLDEILARRPDDAEALLLLVDVELARGTIAFDVHRDLAAAAAHWNLVGATIERLRRLPTPPGRDLRRAEAAWLVRMAHLANARRDLDRAVELFGSARDLRLALLDGAAPDATDSREIGAILRIEESRRHYPAAHAAYEQACRILAVAEQHPDDVPLRQLHGVLRAQYGYCLASSGEYAAGERLMRAAWLDLEQLHGDDEADAGLATSLAGACQRLADHLAIQAKYAGDPAAARQLWTEAAQIARRGLELARPLRDREPDMMTVFVVAECERIEALCTDALK